VAAAEYERAALSSRAGACGSLPNDPRAPCSAELGACYAPQGKGV